MKIKIISNPYKQEIQYHIYKESTNNWIDVSIDAPNGKLREEKVRTGFLPFNTKEILEIIVDEYYLKKNGLIEIIFEGNKDEYTELEKVCDEDYFKDKISLIRSNRLLQNGKSILNDTKEVFASVKPIIEKVTKDEQTITKNLLKVSDALDDVIPICVFGNYSSGKSTFINALIGREILPSGGDPVTAKIFKIKDSIREDVARVKFTHLDNLVELSFKDDAYRLIKGKTEDEMLVELDKTLKDIDNPNMSKMVSVALEFINAYEKKDPLSIEIGNMIELSISFLKTGVLGKSNNKYVIFDTPGSNTATNDGHIEVLKEALEGFSNGIPVWVSQYETIDTMDNETLCNNIMNIDALDKRFTMIVLNKADISDLPEKEFSKKQIENIKEFKSIEKMYASGVFFISSIMGLGSKNNGELNDKYYRKIYKLQTSTFSDPNNEDYLELYKYNIMPQQIKEDVIRYSANERNVVYVNSGLHCVETEIEEFASKFSAYNKCQMVYALLSNVVEKTSEKIKHRVENKKKLRDNYIKNLEEKKKQLIQIMREKSTEMDNQFSNKSYESINSYAKENLDYTYSFIELDELNTKYHKENSEEYDLVRKKKEFDSAIENMGETIKKRVKDIRINNLKDSLSDLVGDTKKGFKEVHNSKKELESTQKDAYSETVDEVLKEVIEKYKKSMSEIENEINHIACDYWKDNSRILKEQLINIVTDSDALASKQKEFLAGLIFNYKSIDFDDKANSIFVKPKFLIGRLLGMNLFSFEKLNIRKLAKEYNTTIDSNIEKISSDMNEKYYNSYKEWQDELSVMIEKNIVDLNQELQVISDSIDNENEEINILETSQITIHNTLKEIEELISFIEVN